MNSNDSHDRLAAPEAAPVLEDWFFEFEKWLVTQMPAGTVISDPRWWAPRIARACTSRFTAAPEAVGVADEEAAAETDDRLAYEWSAANPFPEDLRRNPTVAELQAMAKMFGLEVNDWAALSWLVVTCIAGYGDTAHPAPVPVGERLPGVGDCDAEGKCWWWSSDGPSSGWVLCGPEEGWTRWLPHWALPLPGEA